jgi:hypothetical protein
MSFGCMLRRAMREITSEYRCRALTFELVTSITRKQR